MRKARHLATWGLVVLLLALPGCGLFAQQQQPQLAQTPAEFVGKPRPGEGMLGP